MYKNYPNNFTSHTELYIHGHSSMEISRNEFSLICDPWLSGTAYWRSWWNFPEQTQVSLLKKNWENKRYLYIYLSHLHWDHFHGPTLRNLIKAFPEIKIIIPKTPEKRLKEDLLDFIKVENIIELTHGKKVNIFEDISLLSFQVGIELADSIISIFTSSFNVVNLNDSKILPVSRRHFLSLVPQPTYVFRSHSSANSRCCFRDLNGKINNSIYDKKRIDYSLEFFETCYKLKAKYAIPFASNMACLHKDTFKYNSILNFSDYVLEDFKNYSKRYRGMKCNLLLPSEKIQLESELFFKNDTLRNKLKKDTRINLLKDMQNKHSNTLRKQYLLEKNTKLSFKAFNKYFSKIFNATPLLLRLYLSDKIKFYISSNNKVEKFSLDFIQKSIYSFESIKVKSNDEVNIFVNAYVINDVCRKAHYTSLGVSKRLEIWTDPNNKRYMIFNIICNSIENDAFLPLNKIFSLRYILVWSTRFREMIDIFIYISKLLLLKLPTYKL